MLDDFAQHDGGSSASTEDYQHGVPEPEQCGDDDVFDGDAPEASGAEDAEPQMSSSPVAHTSHKCIGNSDGAVLICNAAVIAGSNSSSSKTGIIMSPKLSGRRQSDAKIAPSLKNRGIIRFCEVRIAN